MIGNATQEFKILSGEIIMDQIICLKLYNVEVTAPLTSSTTFVISERAQCKAHPCSLANLEDAPRELPARATTHAGSRSLRPGRAKTQKKARASAGQGIPPPRAGRALGEVCERRFPPKSYEMSTSEAAARFAWRAGAKPTWRCAAS